MKHFITLSICLFLLIGCKPGQMKTDADFVTFSNPLNLSYRFGLENPSRREAADPTVIWFEDRYFLFASKSGGYWHSQDLLNWIFIETNQIPTEEYAPTAIVIGETVYFLASSNEKSTIYKSNDPLSGEWSVAVEELEIPVWDPAFFVDEDGRLYMFWGCSDVNPIFGVEIDYANNFAFIGEPKPLIFANPRQHGWEVRGDYNTLHEESPWIEGAKMIKHNDRYYLLYSAPGTEFKSYADGVYVSDNPLGPFTLAPHNPVSYKPGGFATGAGHGYIFEDRHGNFWHITTVTISVKHMFERRLALFPTFFDEQGNLHTITRFGDWPIKMPARKITGPEELFPGWMLLSYNKDVNVSSSDEGHSPDKMADECIRTYWAANSGNEGEFAVIDLGQSYDVYAVQINFAEHNTTILGRHDSLFHRYIIEYSVDGANWTMLVDRSENQNDNTHDYIQLNEKVNCRYLRITNVKVPDGHFALSGFRVFGRGHGNTPDAVQRFSLTRNPADRRSVSLSWEQSQGATGYNIVFGVAPNKMYHNFIVYQDTALTINSLHSQWGYYFTIESFNENGYTSGEIMLHTE